MKKNNLWPLIIIGFFTFFGTIAATDGLLVHYNKSDSTFCDIGAGFSCDAVNQSVYSAIWGIPFSLLGIIGYVALAALSILFVWKKKAAFIDLAAGLVLIGFAIQTYLTIVEATIIHIWCLVCLFSQLAITTLLVTIWVWRQKSQKE